MNYSDDDGNPLPVGIASAGYGIAPLAIARSVNFSIPPLGALTISTDGQGPETSGAAVATASIEEFPAGGHFAKFINELFPDTDTDSFEGALVVEVTDGKVAATALELGTQPGEFTTLPLTARQD